MGQKPTRFCLRVRTYQIAAHAGSRDMPHDTIQGSAEASRPRRGGERKDRTNEKRQEAEGVT